MAFLLTGGAGYIGSQMAWKLFDLGHELVVLDNFSSGFAEALPPKVHIVRGNCGDRALLDTVARDHKIAGVFHFAGSISVPESVSQPLDYYENNTANTARLVRACVDHAWGPFIFSSTAAVFGDTGGARVTEDTACAPLSPYGASKWMSERMILDAANAHQLTYTILRYFNVAGADPLNRAGQRSPHSQHLLSNICRVAAGDLPALTLYGDDYPTPDGTCIRDYIHIADLIEAHWLAYEALASAGESAIYNCGYGDGFSVREMIQAYERVAKAPLAYRLEARRDGDASMLVADGSKLRNALGWRPQYAQLDLIVEHALSWDKKLRAAR